MLNKFEEKVLEAYQNGSDIGYIIEKLNTTHGKIKEVLLAYKETNRHKRTFTDEFKKMIAERDINGVSRRQISIELEINVNTVKKACEQFGQAFKERASSENEYTRIELEKFDLTTCPVCGSKKVNIVEDNTTYCKSCGEECEQHKIFEEVEKVDSKGKTVKKQVEVGAYAMKLNWEYLEE